MGNCFALCKPTKRSDADKISEVVQIVKTDGKMLKPTSPITVKELLVNFSRFGVAVSETAPEHLLPDYPSSTQTSSAVETEQAGGIRRIKVVISKQQLQELLSKQVSIEEVLSALKRKTCSSVDSPPPSCWKPKLESITEE